MTRTATNGLSGAPGGNRQVEREEREEWKGSVDKNAEPEITYEADIPSDGPDPEGEAEIKKIVPKPELSTPPDNARQ